MSSATVLSAETKLGGYATRWAGAMVAVLVVLCFSTPTALAQCSLTGTVSSWTAGNSNWNNGTNWDSGIPNSSSTSACITNGTLGTPSVVALDINASVDDLQLGSYDTLNFNGGTSLYVYGPQIINGGQINVNGGGGTNTYLYLDNSVTLSGGGTLTLSTTAAGGGNAWLYQNGALTLTNVDNTIQGEGYIYNNGAAIINETGGTINANSTGSPLTTTLEIDYGSITNQGLLEATNSGVLQLYDNTINNAGGNITAGGAGATVNVYSTTIQGGTLNNSTGGTMQTMGTSVLDGSTHGALTLSSGSTYATSSGYVTEVFGTLNNQGTFQVNGGGGSNTYLYTIGNTTLQSGGTVSLSTTAASGGNAYLYQTGAYTLNNGNSIQGEGIIYNNGAIINNQATINANSTGGALATTLALQYGTVNNTGLLEATNSGVLQLFDATVGNAGANITATGSGVLQLYYDTINNSAGGNITASGAGASIQLEGTTIQGGTLGGAITALSGTSLLDGSTYGALTLVSGSTYTIAGGATTEVQGTINNPGTTFQVNGGGGQNTYLYTTGNTTLTGAGTVTLNTTAASGGNAYLYQDGGYTLDNVKSVIQGEGYIYNNGATLINEAGGTINANSTGSPLTTTLEIQYGNITNQGLMEATNSGVLQLYDNTINNAGGNITAGGAGATVNVYSTTIQGGTLNNSTGGTMQTMGTSVLDGSTHGALTLSSGSTYATSSGYVTEVFGTLNNQGTFQVNGGGGSNTYLYTIGNTTLQSGGTVSLSTTAASGGNANLYQGGGYTLNNSNTIQGEGIIYNNGAIINNQATINANSTGGALATTLYLEYGTVNNTGLLEATNSGVLELYANTINNQSANITSNGIGADVQVYSTTIAGGTLTTAGGGTMETYGTSVLDGSTHGALTLSPGSTYATSSGYVTEVFGTINNQGNFQVNGGGGANTYLETIGNTTLTGGGTVTLSTTAASGGSAWLYQSGSVTLDNVSNTIQGEGIIYNNGATLINETGGSIIANSTGSPLTTTLDIEYGTVTNNGILQANSGNTLWLYNGSLTNFSGNTLTGGTYNVYGTSGSPGTLQIDSLGNTGGEIVNNAATILLDGPNSNFVDAAGLDALSNFNNNLAAGSFTIQNGRNFTSPAGGFSNAGTVTVGNASTLTSSGGYTQSGGTTQGIGTIAGNVSINGGAIQPGLPSAPGTLSIAGSYNQTGSTFAEQILGAGAGQFGVLNVTGGTATLGSAADLNITLLGSFDPVGNTFTIFTDPSGISGTFANAPASGFQMDGYNWTAAYNPTSIVLDAVSEVGGLVTATWTSGSGHWTTATEWNCTPGPGNCVPNNNGSNLYAAVLNSTGNTLTLDSTDSPSSITVNSLNIEAGELDVKGGASLTVTGTTALGSSVYDVIHTDGSTVNLGTLSNLLGGVLSGGGYQPGGAAAGTIIINGNVTTLASGTAVILDQAGSELSNGAGDALAGLTTNYGFLNLYDGATETLTPGGGTFANNGGTLNSSFGGSSLTIAGNLSNTNGGIVNVNGGGGASFNVGGTFTNDNSSVTLENGGALNTGDFTNQSSGSVQVNGGSTLAVTGALSNSGNINTGNAGSGGNSITVSGLLTNNGTITLAGVGDSLSADLTNSGAINLSGNGATLTDAGDFNNNSGGSLSLTADLNSVTVSGTFNNNAGASVTMSGTNGSLSAVNAFVNGGTVTLSGSGDTLSALAFSNTGTVSIGAHETLATTSGHPGYTYTQTAGSTTVDGILIAAASGVSLQGGSLLGAGAINGNLDNSGGTVQPGAPGAPDTLAIDGNYTQGSAGTLVIDLGGTGDYSVLSVSGSATLDGTVDFQAVDGFTPAAGEDFTFLTWGLIDPGNFSKMEFTGDWSACPSGDTCTDVFGSNSLTLEITPSTTPTPEPPIFLLLGLGIALMTLFRKYRNSVGSV